MTAAAPRGITISVSEVGGGERLAVLNAADIERVRMGAPYRSLPGTGATIRHGWGTRTGAVSSLRHLDNEEPVWRSTSPPE
jgi:hypothetical protein